MKFFRYNPWLILFIAVGLVASLVICWERHQVEMANRQVDLAIDYEGLIELSQREGIPLPEMLAKAKESGITSLAVYETTFKKLNENGKAHAAAGSEILAAYHSGTLSDSLWRELCEAGVIRGDEVYVTGHDPQTFREVKEDLVRRLGDGRIKPLAVGAEEVLAVKAHYESFLKMNLGMPTDEMQAVNRAGFKVVARPSNYLGCTEDDVKAVFRRLEGIDVSEVVFSGPECLGAAKALQTTIDELKARNLTLGLIEGVTQLQFYPQTGMTEIAKGIGYDHVARVYSVPRDEQPKLKLETIVERWANTDQERNIRLNLLRIYDKPSPNMTLLETNLKYFTDTRDILTAKGYTFGHSGTYAAYYPPTYLRALVMPGVAAAIALYLSLVIPKLNVSFKGQMLLWFILAAAMTIPVAMGAGSKVRLMASLASANLFPSIAVIWQLDRIRRRKNRGDAALPRLLLTGVIALFCTGALSMIGAAYLSASLADVEYFLEFNIFRGIKLTFILPLVLVAIAFLQRFDIFDGKMDDTAGFASQFKRILDMPVKIKTLLGLGVMAIAAVIFIARSGHTSGMPVSGLELKFRALLEETFYARPRSKELLIGHPAFMLAAMAWRRKWPTLVLFVLTIVAVIGQGSMVETFAHMRTPVYMSFMRGIGGLALGAMVGAVAMVLVDGWNMLWQKVKVTSK
ncbi:MAG: hypothetical protein IJ849_04960 [Selenomonadaceae bacterium]|nr:hypothetical protein [Selenomonadaceae bacterium]